MKLCILTICIIGYAGNDVVGKIKKTIPPIIVPVAKKTSPILFSLPFPKELNNPAYNNILQ